MLDRYEFRGDIPMRFIISFVLCFLSITVFAAPPSLIIKNQYGEQSNNIVLGGTFSQNGLLILPSEAIGVAHALSTTIAESIVSNPSGSTYAVTLAAPSNQDGQIKVIKAGATMTHTVTMALTNVSMSGGYTPTGTTTLTFTSAGQSAVFIAIGVKWVYLGGSAVAS